MDADTVASVRRFNRTVTERVGALDESYLGRGRALGETRLLWEIGADGADVRDLRRRLGLDAGYASRLLRSLESEGLVAVEPGTLKRVRGLLSNQHVVELIGVIAGYNMVSRFLVALDVDGDRFSELFVTSPLGYGVLHNLAQR